MGSQQTQQKQSTSVRNHHRSGGKNSMEGSARLISKVPRETPGAPLPPRSNVCKPHVDGLTALDFASAARQLTLATQRRGLQCPLFRSPPDLPGISRSIRRNRDGSATVSVVVRGRYRLAVLADMIDGVAAANHLEFGDASRMRDALWSAVSSEAAAKPLQTKSAPTGRAEVDSPLEQKPDFPTDRLLTMTVGPVAA